MNLVEKRHANIPKCGEQEEVEAVATAAPPLQKYE